MDDDRVWRCEESLWTGDADNYARLMDTNCLLVLPTAPYVFDGRQAVDAVASTPRWTAAAFSDGRIERPEEGLIVVAYHMQATRDDEGYAAWCTSTYRRRGHEDWQVVQHQQTIPPTAKG